MSSKRTTFAQDQALHWIARRLADFPESAFPSLRKCALLCGVSLRTFQLAVQTMKQRGLLEARPGSGTWPQGKAPARLKNVDSAGAHKDWSARIEEGFRSISFAGGVLPPIKDLTSRWNVSAPTLRKALRVLQRKGSLERRGNRWYPVQSQGFPTQDKPLEVWLVCASSGDQLLADSTRVSDFYRTIEEECQRFALKLMTIHYDVQQQKMPLLGPSDWKRCAGVIVSTWLLPNSVALLKTIAKWNLPMSIWLENEELLPELPKLIHRKNMAWFCISYNADSGRELGKNLMQRGYNHALYISPYHGATWSQNRLAGLAETLERVDPLCDSRCRDAWGFRNAGLQKMKKNVLQDWLDVPETIYKYPQIPLAMKAKWDKQVCDFIQDMEVLEALRPLLAQAVRSPATAWVFASDHCALLALQLIAPELRPRVIASFDNTPEARAVGIESFEFNTRGMVQAMVEHLLHPSHPLYPYGLLRQPKGHVVERAKHNHAKDS